MSVVDLKHLRFVFGRNFIDIFIKLRVMPQIDLVLILLLHELLVPAFQVDGRRGGGGGGGGVISTKYIILVL